MYRIIKLSIRLLALIVTPCMLSLAMAEPGSSSKKLNFKVYLDAKEIGSQQVTIKPTISGEQVNIQAKFNIKFLFFNAYSYRHTVEEIWKNQCLESINSTTTENGDESFVRSELTKEGLNIITNLAETSHTGCIRSFAYWDPQRLDSERLLNAQSGEHVPAKFSSIGEVVYQHEGSRITAKQYQLDAEGSEIRLWYSAEGEWLALKTKIKGGRELAYHRVIEADVAE